MFTFIITSSPECIITTFVAFNRFIRIKFFSIVAPVFFVVEFNIIITIFGVLYIPKAIIVIGTIVPSMSFLKTIAANLAST